MVGCRIQQNILNFISFFFTFIAVFEVLICRIAARGQQRCVGSLATLLLANAVFFFSFFLQNMT